MPPYLEELRLLARRFRRMYATAKAMARLMRRFPTATIDPSVTVVSPERLKLGDRVVLQHGAHLHCGGRSWSKGAGSIHIGSYGVISPYCVLYGAGGIEIGDHFDCGPGTMIFSSRSSYEPELSAKGQEHELAEVKIGNGVIVYAGCIVGPGVTIGHGAVVGAGSVVLTDVPPRTLYAGTPARLIRTLNSDRSRPGDQS
jgi:maltose O-acetyltransferase